MQGPPTMPTTSYDAQAFEPPRTSASAITSLVTGILICIPVVTGLAAIVFGILGIKATARPNVRGRGLAIAGLVLGCVGLLAQAGIGLAVWSFVSSSEPAREYVRTYMDDFYAGNFEALSARSHPAFDVQTLSDYRDYLDTHGGTYSGLSFRSMHAQSSGGSTTWTLGGSADYSAGPAEFQAVVRSNGDGTYTMISLNVWDNPRTWPPFQQSP